MAPLTHLLERLRHIQPPPGAAASIVAVPSPGDELTVEVAGLFPDLDEIERRAAALIAAARSAAAEPEATAVGERRSLPAARTASGMLADAARRAERVRARGRQRTPALVTELVNQLLAGGR